MSGISNESNEQNNGSTSGNTIIFNQVEMFQDMDMAFGNDYLTTDYKSLDDGDILIFKDVISEITYDSDIEATKVSFEYSPEEGGTLTSNFWFNEDISNKYQVGNQVKITLTIKHVEFTYEDPNLGTEMNFDMEVFKEGWESEEYFVSNQATATRGVKPMPQSYIEIA